LKVERAKSFENSEKIRPASEGSPAVFHLTFHERLVNQDVLAFSQQMEDFALARRIEGGSCSDLVDGPVNGELNSRGIVQFRDCVRIV